MKNIILTFIGLILINFGFSQTTKTIILAEGKRPLENYLFYDKLETSPWKISRSIRDLDTSIYFNWRFQNAEYSYLCDQSSVYFSERDDLLEFVNTLKEFSLKTNRENIETKVGRYIFKLKINSNSVYIYDIEGKYTWLRKKRGLKMANEILLNVNLLKVKKVK